MKVPRPGLLGRVLLIQAAALGLAALLVPFAADALLANRVSFYEHAVLRSRAQLVAEALYANQEDELRLAPGRFERQGERREFGYAVVGGNGAVLLSSTPFAAGLLSPTARNNAVRFSELSAAGRHYAVVSLPVRVADRSVWVLLGWDLDTEEVIFDDVVRDFLPTAIAVSVPLLGLLLLVNLLVVRRFFRPVLRVAREIRAMDPARTDARLPARELPPEIAPLATAFNGALDRVEQGVRLQQEFTADAAHELRTPLAVLDARLQTLGESALRTELLGDVRRMGRVVGQLLDLARMEGSETLRGEADLVAACGAVVAELAPEAIGKGQELSLLVPDGVAAIPVIAREQDVWHMVRNLLENAIRHTPPGTAIEVRLHPDGELEVRDDGPGIPVEQHEQVFRRFWRSRRNEGSGAGLGLSIVQRVAQANGGGVRLVSGPGQGTSFRVRLPLVRLAPPGRSR